jgi:uncharacterized protein YcfJ
MNKLMMNTLNVALMAALAVGVSACNRSASADPSNGAAVSAAGGEVGGAPGSGPAPQQQGGAQAADNGMRYAQVVSVEPVRQSTNDPKKVCHDQVVTHTAPPRDQHHIAGTAIGAVAGGLLGHMVGGGRGNTLTTVAGAVGGGYAGNRIEASHQQGQVTQTVERRCDTVDNASSKVVAFDVRYVYKGVTRSVRMDHDPGDRVQVQEGVTAVSDAR